MQERADQLQESIESFDETHDGREANRLMFWANNLLNRYGPKAIEAGKRAYDAAKPHVQRSAQRAAEIARQLVGNAKAAPKLTVTFGRNANQIEHAFRHTDKLGLSRTAVQEAVQRHLPSVADKIPSGSPLNQVIEVGGKQIQYSAFRLPDDRST